MHNSQYMMDNSEYEDIINLEHPTSKRHPRMTMMQRAAQFASFAALNGHSESIGNAAQQWEQLHDHADTGCTELPE